MTLHPSDLHADHPIEIQSIREHVREPHGPDAHEWLARLRTTAAARLGGRTGYVISGAIGLLIVVAAVMFG